MQNNVSLKMLFFSVILTAIILIAISVTIIHRYDIERNEYRQIVLDDICSQMDYGIANCTWEFTYEDCKDLAVITDEWNERGVDVKLNYMIVNRTNTSQTYTEELLSQNWTKICKTQMWCNGERNYTHANIYSNGTFSCVGDEYWYKGEIIVPKTSALTTTGVIK